MKTIDTNHESPIAPAVLAILAGGGAVAWMLYQKGFEMFEHWYFYPSLLLLVVTCVSLSSIVGSKLRRLAWAFCMWWSGIWTLVFFLAFAAPPFSMFIVGSLVAPILDAGRIGPFSAGFLHLFMWACARDIVKHLDIEDAEQAAS
jgi:hypothetical protein